MVRVWDRKIVHIYCSIILVVGPLACSSIMYTVYIYIVYTIEITIDVQSERNFASTSTSMVETPASIQ